ncbi:MAG: histidinol dehydrogenase [Bacillota bacterium]
MRVITASQFRAEGVTASPQEIRERVRELLEDVRKRGDEALRYYGKRFDSWDGPLVREVPGWQEAKSALEPAVVHALERACDSLFEFHSQCGMKPFRYRRADGAVLGRKVIPLKRVGAYIPGGLARYPSSVLMAAVPARIAGVKELVVCTPPGDDVSLAPVYAACALVHIDRLYLVGGPWAVAAMAYGTESIPRVDKLVGPGGQYVTEAKRLVFGQVDIDMLAGPSEVVIWGDDSADPELVTLDMLSQMEHDSLAVAYLVTDSAGLLSEVECRLRQHDARGSAVGILAEDSREAASVIDAIAPEHLQIMAREAQSLADAVCNAGVIYLGPRTPTALGDYAAGTNHVLPTAGSSRFFSGLTVENFQRSVNVADFTDCTDPAYYAAAAVLAEVEGLPCHARALKARLKEETMQ